MIDGGWRVQALRGDMKDAQRLAMEHGTWVAANEKVGIARVDLGELVDYVRRFDETGWQIQ